MIPPKPFICRVVLFGEVPVLPFVGLCECGLLGLWMVNNKLPLLVVASKTLDRHALDWGFDSVRPPYASATGWAGCMGAAQTTDCVPRNLHLMHPCSLLVVKAQHYCCCFLRRRPQATLSCHILPTACLVATRLPWGTVWYKLRLLDWRIGHHRNLLVARHLTNLCSIEADTT